MEWIPLELSGSLTDELRTKYGGGYSFWDNLKMGGTGSHKLLFHDGPQAIHTLNDSSLETLQVSFQYLREAFLLRLNIARKISGWIVRYSDIEAVNLGKEMATGEKKPVLYYTCTLQLASGAALILRMHKSDRKHFLQYFKKGPLLKKLEVAPDYIPTPQ